ncbi:exodeoxyribonuclease VII large subunit [Rhodobacteraceae bacterium DSL-40]|uniref:exodeoxyribonuclease VII large subunit n=1 Tax=Amaricoccus sp. B4 TaxID=3368557 RepID=UPI000DACCA02
MELFEDSETGSNAPEFTVSELSGAIKRVIEGEFAHVRVRGEVGRVSRPASGHIYLDLKDDRAVLAGVIWKGAARSLEIRPEEGMEVIATGRLTTFPGSSRYQIIIESIAPAGMGALMAMLEKRKAALAAEGLFAPERKRPLPFLPEVIGVVTSPSGAVIRDILHRLADRFPRRVLLWPVPVQGEKCAASVAAAIRGFNALPAGGALPRPDVLIVARGGGSVEDLWGFNEEIVVRAAAESAIPLISAVGHETDTTLIDLAADRRAPTPTAAAEIAVPVRLELLAAVAGLEERRRAALARGLDLRRQRLRDLARALPRPEALVAERAQRLDGLGLRLPRALVAFTRDRHLELSRGAAGRFGPALLARSLERRREQLLRAGLGLRPQTMALPIRHRGERLAALGDRLARAGAQRLQAGRGRFEILARTLGSLGPEAVLARGFAIVRDGAGAVLQRAERARAATSLEIEFADGRLTATPADAPPPSEPPAAPKAKPRRPRKPKPPEQGSLF